MFFLHGLIFIIYRFSVFLLKIKPQEILLLRNREYKKLKKKK